MKTLTTEHLSGYLPYGLKCEYTNTFGDKEIGKLTDCRNHDEYYLFAVDSCWDKNCKPILHPLSDLTEKELRKNGFWHHIDFLTVEKGMPIHAPYEMVVYLFSKHYDVFGLIEQNLAIDYNTLNPKL